MAAIIQPVDAYAGLGSLIKQRTGKEILTDNVVDWLGVGQELANMDGTTSQIVTGDIATLVTEQVVLPAVYKSLDVNIVTSFGEYTQSVGITQRSRPAIPDLESDKETYDPTPGSSSDPFVNYGIEMFTNYFFKALQAKIVWSIPERVMTGAFLSERGFSDFVTAIYSAVRFQVNAMIDALTFSAIRGSIALTLQQGVGNQLYNLLPEYNVENPDATPLTAANAMTNPDFLRFSSKRINVVMDDMKQTTVLFNEKGYPVATDFDTAHVLILSRFQRDMQAHLQSDTFHKELVALPNHKVVASWQGPLAVANGGITFASASTVKDTFKFSNADGAAPIAIDQVGVVAHFCSNRRISIEDLGEHTESMRDPDALKTNHFTHLSARTIVDDYEPAVTFIVADEDPVSVP